MNEASGSYKNVLFYSSGDLASKSGGISLVNLMDFKEYNQT